MRRLVAKSAFLILLACNGEQPRIVNDLPNDTAVASSVEASARSQRITASPPPEATSPPTNPPEYLNQLTAWADTVTSWLREDSSTIAADSTLLEVLPMFRRRIQQVEGAMSSVSRDTGEMRRHGIWVSSAEGLMSLELHESVFYDSYGRFVTPAMRQYLEVRIVEQVAPSALDGAIAVPLDELARRLTTADRFLVEHPQAVARSPMVRQFRHYLIMFLAGLPNTPAFDSSGQLIASFRQHHEEYVARYGTANAGRIVAEYLHLMREHHFKDGAHVGDFLKSKTGVF